MNDTLDSFCESHFESNFNLAIKMSDEGYDYQALMGFLASENIVEKQIAILDLKEIKSKADAQTLVSNLVGQDGKIREAVAFKVNELVKTPQYADFFNSKNIFEILSQGIMDINGNVCRQIVELVGIYEPFKKALSTILPEKISLVLDEIEKIDNQSRQYVISKRNFQLYWCLEALYSIVELIDPEKIKNILLKTGVFKDYTIREKTAKILTVMDNSEIVELKEKLRKDENYYVRRYLK